MNRRRYRQPTLYRVSGRGPVAITGRIGLDDMLRYDGCTLVGDLTDGAGNAEVIVAFRPGRTPTVERWRSFGWRIEPLASQGQTR